jgi:hypothetical protein
MELAVSALFVGILAFTVLFSGLLCWAIWAVFIRTTFYRMRGSHVLVPLPPGAALEALMKRMAEEGYELTTSKRYTAIFRRRCQPDRGVCGLLILVGLIPGLLYYLLASTGSLSSIAAAERLSTDETRVSIYGVDFKAYKIGWEWGKDTREVHKKVAPHTSSRELSLPLRG